MSNATTNDVHAATIARSDQQNADDLIAGPITVTVESVRKGSKEQPIIIELEGHPGRPWKPCKGMLRILIAGWSDNPHEWVGKRLTLFRNPDVKYAGVKVGGIEISHMSDIPPTLEAAKTIAKGVKAPFIVKRLEAPKAPELTEVEVVYIDDASNEINNAETLEALKAIWFVVNQKSDAVKAKLLPLKDARKKVLTTESEQ